LGQENVTARFILKEVGGYARNCEEQCEP
jgi:hypothetical protein